MLVSEGAPKNPLEYLIENIQSWKCIVFSAFLSFCIYFYLAAHWWLSDVVSDYKQVPPSPIDSTFRYVYVSATQATSQAVVELN